jgi:hypothetical protein
MIKERHFPTFIDSAASEAAKIVVDNISFAID